MNTKIGGEKYKATMIKKYGSLEAWKEFQAEIGAVGGKTSYGKPQGFAVNPEFASRMGKIGGKLSHRTKESID